MKFQKRALASAISIALTAPAGAAVTIDQLINYNFEQYADNVIDIEAAVAVSLGFDDLGNVVPSTQLGSLQANVVGWGTTGGSATSALDVSGVSFMELTQDIEMQGSFEFGQNVENYLEADVDIDSKIASVDVRAVSQIGSLAANAAAFNLNGDVTVNVLQTGDFDQDVADQRVYNDIELQVERGSINFDGGYLADAEATDLTRSVQLGSTTFNALQLYTNPETAGDITLKLAQDSESMNASTINRVTAFTDNESPLVADPSISNLDQLALQSFNTVNVTLDEGATLSLQGANADAEGYGAAAAQYYDRGLFQFEEGGAFLESAGTDLINILSASTGEDLAHGVEYGSGSTVTDMGFLVNNASDDFTVDYMSRNVDSDYEGGFGDAMISDVAQRSVLSINTIGISGTNDGESTGVAGATTIGSIDDLDLVLTFEQNLQGLNLQNAYTGDWGGEGDGDESFLLNELSALTGVGNAAVTGFEQIQAVSGNTLSTTGDLTGISVGLVDYYPGTVEGGDYGLSFTDINLNNAYTPGEDDGYYSAPDLRQIIGDTEGEGLGITGEDYDFIDLDLLNTAIAGVDDNGIATVGGDQTLAVTLNSLSASGVGSGFFVQGFDMEETNFANVELQNLSAALVGQRGMASVDSTTQTGVTSINTMAFGMVGPAVLAQTTGGVDVYLRTDNNLTAGSEDRLTESVSVADVTQAVINRVNAISAINP